MARKTYNEKLLDSKDMPKIEELIDEKEILRHGGTKLLIAPPVVYDEIMKSVPEKMIITADYLRAYLAKKYGADNTCPLTAGIFINIVAQASAERIFDETPYWRTLKKNGELNERYPEGVNGQKQHLESEGHVIIQKGKRFFVKDYLKHMFDLNSL